MSIPALPKAVNPVIYISSTVILKSDMSQDDDKKNRDLADQTTETTQSPQRVNNDHFNHPADEKYMTESFIHKEPEPSSEKSTKPAKKEGGIVSLFVTIVVALLLVQIINAFFLQSYRVYGSSMYSTLENNDRLIISKFGKTSSKITGKTYAPKRADIIVFQSPIDPDIQLIKRVIGLPGDRVVVKDGHITIFNKDNPEGFNPDDASYGKDLPKTSGNTDITVPKDHIFVSGDNREGGNSLDSRNELGTVPEDNIIGTLKVRIWPLNDAKFF